MQVHNKNLILGDLEILGDREILGNQEIVRDLNFQVETIKLDVLKDRRRGHQYWKRILIHNNL